MSRLLLLLLLPGCYLGPRYYNDRSEPETPIVRARKELLRALTQEAKDCGNLAGSKADLCLRKSLGYELKSVFEVCSAKHIESQEHCSLLYANEINAQVVPYDTVLPYTTWRTSLAKLSHSIEECHEAAKAQKRLCEDDPPAGATQDYCARRAMAQITGCSLAGDTDIPAAARWEMPPRPGAVPAVATEGGVRL